jgi:hypothetical protein
MVEIIGQAVCPGYLGRPLEHNTSRIINRCARKLVTARVGTVFFVKSSGINPQNPNEVYVSQPSSAPVARADAQGNAAHRDPTCVQRGFTPDLSPGKDLTQEPLA